jgi:hypothetical protein
LNRTVYLPHAPHMPSSLYRNPPPSSILPT